MTFDLILVDTNPTLCKMWQEYFADLPRVTVENGRFQALKAFDCMVSAANSFGLMDGGVDWAITDYFGEQLMLRVQQHIINDFMGEQPVGTSFIIGTAHPAHPWLAHTPTMRVPLEIAHTDNVYRAMFAMLRAVHHHNQSSATPIRTVACPGLGTGVGRVPLREGARQMALAYRNFLNPPTRITWQYASDRQLEVRYGGDVGFHIPPET